MFDINLICRTCLNESTDLVSIHQIFKDSINFADMISFLLGSDTESISRSPTKMCTVCKDKLIVAYLFKKQCSESEIFLEGEMFKEFEITCEETTNVDPLDLDPQVSDEEIKQNFEKSDTDLENSITELKPKHNDYENIKENLSTLDVKKPKTKAIRKRRKIGRMKISGKTCLECNKTFECFAEHLEHKKSEHAADKYNMACEICGKRVTRENYTTHVRGHVRKEQHPCPHCGHIFAQKSNLLDHIRIHKGDLIFQCQHCDQRYSNRNALNSHRLIRHTSETRYECSVCKKRFKRSPNYTAHLRSHTGEKPFECTQCDKVFRTNVQLKRHSETHNEDRNYTCPHCPKAFKTRPVLRYHLKTHTNDRDYLCPVCPKAFTHGHVLRTHMATHPGCPIPASGTILSQKALARMKAEDKTSTTSS